jgi:hypothetical protein
MRSAKVKLSIGRQILQTNEFPAPGKNVEEVLNRFVLTLLHSATTARKDCGVHVDAQKLAVTR